MGGEQFSIVAVLSAIDKGFTSGLDAAAAKAKSFSDGSKLSMESIGTGMTVAGAAVTAMGVKSLKSFGQFESSLNQAAVVAGGTAKDIGQLDDLANKMGADLPLSAQDCADAMIEMARNGASIGDIKKQFPAIAQAATAAGADIKVTAGVVQESMNIWGKSLDSPQQAAAILVQTANASNASIEDMQQALATIGGPAGQAHMSMQVVSESIGLLTNKGFSAAQASMDLGHAITQMMAPSAVAKKAMNDLGISFTDAQGNMKKFPDILRDLNQALDKLSPDEKAQKLKALFGASGMQAILPLMDSVKNKTNDTKVSWDAYAKAQEKAAGSTKKSTQSLKDQANEMQKNVGSSIEQLGGNWESLRNKSMKSFQGVNGSLIQNANQIMQWATTSNSGIAQFTRGFIGLSPSIGAATTSVGLFLRNAKTIAGTLSGGITGISNFIKVGVGIVQVASGAKTATEAFGALAESSKLASIAQWAFNNSILSNPITWVVVGIAAVVAALVLFFTKTKTGQQMWSNFVNWLKDAWQSLVQVAQTVWNAIAKAFTSYVSFIKSFWSGIASFFTELWQGIVKTAQVIWNGLVFIFRTVYSLSMAVWRPIIAFFKNLWTGIIAVAKVLWNGLVVIFRTVYSLSMAVWRPIVSFFKNLWQKILIVTRVVWNAIRLYISTVFKNIQTVIKAGMNIIKTVFSAGWKILSTITSAAWKTIRTVIRTYLSAISGLIKAGMDLIHGDWSGAWNAIKGVAQTVWNGIKSVVQTGINAVQSIVRTAMNAVKGVFSSIWNGIKGIFNNNVQFIKSVMHVDLSAQGRAIMNSLLRGLKHAWESVKNFVGGIGKWIKEHKGPLSYDEQLLIPAGQAIMSGLNGGLTTGFSDVQDNVSSMAGVISSQVTSIMDKAQNALDDDRLTIPAINSQQYSESIDRLNGMVQGGSYSQNITMQESGLQKTNTELLRKIANKDNTMVLDDGTLVAKTAPKMDESIGNKVNLKDRWSK